MSNIKETWEEIKRDLNELDEIEFASARDSIFKDVDRLLQQQKSEIVKNMVDSYIQGFNAAGETLRSIPNTPEFKTAIENVYKLME